MIAEIHLGQKEKKILLPYAVTDYTREPFPRADLHSGHVMLNTLIDSATFVSRFLIQK